jgi:hypothetical protein
MPRTLRFVALLFANAFVAVFGTAMAESPLYRFLPTPHTVSTVLLKETVVSIIVAALIGFGMWRTWRSEPAKWTWIVTCPWFVFAGLAPTHSSYFGSLFPINNPGPGEVRSFLSFTIVAIRGIAFSIGAYISSRIYAAAPSNDSPLEISEQ